MSNVPTSPAVTPDEPISRTQMLRIIADTIDAGLPAPSSVTMADHALADEKMHLTLRMGGFVEDGASDAAAVAAWAQYLGAEVEVSDLYEEGSPRPWRAHAVGDSVASPIKWYGWGIRVWASVRESQGGSR